MVYSILILSKSITEYKIYVLYYIFQYIIIILKNIKKTYINIFIYILHIL